MSAPDHGPTGPAAFPTPASGAGSADLSTDSNDPQELRALLERARERLSFYESFDKIIAENMRHTGEMMAETVALRERAASEAKEREAADTAMRAEREQHRALLEGALGEVRNVQPMLASMAEHLQEALDAIGSAPAEPKPEAVAPVPPVQPEPAVEEIAPASPEPERLTPDVPAMVSPEPPTTEEPAVETPVEVPEPVDDVSPSDESPATIEILAHGVPSAATAIGLQQMLREIDVIRRVDAREFADGELRLHIECAGEIPDERFTEWLAHNSGSLVSRNAKAIELSFG